MVPCAKSDRYTPEVFSQSWKVVGRCSHHGPKGKKDPEARQPLQLLWGMHKDLATFHHQWQKAQLAMVPRRSTYHPFPEGPDSPKYLFPSLLTWSFQWKGRDEKVEARQHSSCPISHPNQCWGSSTRTLQKPLLHITHTLYMLLLNLYSVLWYLFNSFLLNCSYINFDLKFHT